MMKNSSDLNLNIREVVIKEICRSSPDYEYLYKKIKFFVESTKISNSLFKAASLTTGRTIEQIKSKSRKKEDVLARSLIYLEMKDNKGAKFKDIANVFGLDHASIMNSYYNIKEGLEVKDPYYVKSYRVFQKNL